MTCKSIDIVSSLIYIVFELNRVFCEINWIKSIHDCVTINYFCIWILYVDFFTKMVRLRHICLNRKNIRLSNEPIDRKNIKSNHFLLKCEINPLTPLAIPFTEFPKGRLDTIFWTGDLITFHTLLKPFLNLCQPEGFLTGIAPWDSPP